MGHQNHSGLKFAQFGGKGNTTEQHNSKKLILKKSFPLWFDNLFLNSGDNNQHADSCFRLHTINEYLLNVTSWYIYIWGTNLSIF